MCVCGGGVEEGEVQTQDSDGLWYALILEEIPAGAQGTRTHAHMHVLEVANPGSRLCEQRRSSTSENCQVVPGTT